ncbi:MAG: ParB/Srx family N-terminal domain-containing protein [Pseudomonadota bacterium]
MEGPVKFEDIDITKAPPLQRLEAVNDLYDISFTVDGLAAVEVPFALLDSLPLVGAERGDGPRLTALLTTIRRTGFRPRDPIICRIGMKGRWVIVDGGHRVTAARIVGRSFWSWLFGRRVERLYFLLFTTPDSWCKLRPPRGPGAAPSGPPAPGESAQG